MRPETMILVFWMLSFKPAYPLSTEEVYKKDLHNLDGVITHLEPDILEWEIKWKDGLKLNIQKTKIMAYGPITS